jgi:hypothetical protein
MLFIYIVLHVAISAAWNTIQPVIIFIVFPVLPAATSH